MKQAQVTKKTINNLTENWAKGENRHCKEKELQIPKNI